DVRHQKNFHSTLRDANRANSFSEGKAIRERNTFIPYVTLEPKMTQAAPLPCFRGGECSNRTKFDYKRGGRALPLINSATIRLWQNPKKKKGLSLLEMGTISTSTTSSTMKKCGLSSVSTPSLCAKGLFMVLWRCWLAHYIH
ncbi:MAG: hypothetical protein QG629_373, partial [Patescibacteria group bacterium]|nr:hypothetical protein [Patescibacteria group bacterium]